MLGKEKKSEKHFPKLVLMSAAKNYSFQDESASLAKTGLNVRKYMAKLHGFLSFLEGRRNLPF